jgi:6-pyruvoyltetrahydropterin/6-carboxytetrahydropterin synthase
MVYLTRREHFNAAHRLHNANWSAEKNEEWVTVKGEPNPDTGFIMNAKELSLLIKREVVERFDHMNLNMDVPFFSDMQPSTENFVKVIWKLLEPHITECKLHAIKLQETENIYCEYFGE